MKFEKIIVTGGAGFIGSNLCEALINNGSSVISIDNYSMGSKENHVPGVTYLEEDTSNIRNIKFPWVPDVVYHFGEYSRVEQSFNDIDKVWSSNKIGTFEVIKFCLENKIKLIYAGSSTKFGDGGLGRSQSPYGWTKASNTELVKNIGEWYGLKYAIVYFYNAYGPKEIKDGKYATLIAKFIKMAKNGEPLSVVKPGIQKRNFTHVDDIIEALILVGKHAAGDDFGIGNDRSYTIMEVAQLFNRQIVMLPERAGNRLDAELVTDKTKALGWSAKVSLEEYIKTQMES